MDNNNFFESYNEERSISYKLRQPKFWIMLFAGVISLVFLFIFVKSVTDSISPETLKACIEISDIDTKWVNKKVTPREVTIVPSVKFKIKNKKEIVIDGKTVKNTTVFNNVKFIGTFVYRDIYKDIKRNEKELIGDGVGPTLRIPLNPGEKSEEIFIKSLNGYRATSKKSFLNNKDWKPIEVNIFAKTTSKAVLLGTFPVSKIIEGIEDEVYEKKRKLDKQEQHLLESVRIVWKESSWVYKKATAKQIIFVPVINIRIKNTGENALKDLIVRADFEDQTTGEHFQSAIPVKLKSGPLKSGELTDIIKLKGEFGYTVSSVKSLQQNKNQIKKLNARVYIKHLNGKDILLGTFTVTREVKMENK